MNPLFLHEALLNILQSVEVWIFRNASRLVLDSFQLDIEIVRFIGSLDNLIENECCLKKEAELPEV